MKCSGCPSKSDICWYDCEIPTHQHASQILEDIRDFHQWTHETTQGTNPWLSRVYTPKMLKWLYDLEANDILPGIKEIYEDYLQQKAKNDEILLQEYNKYINGKLEEVK
jgi:uncharacterized protein (DUF2342 family)